METLSFAFGMLTVFGVALATVAVVGIVKVFRLQKELTNSIAYSYRASDDLHQRISKEIDTLSRVISDDRRELNQQISETYSYVDSRFDKFENKLNERYEAARKALESRELLND